jgi:hypothetical protein
VTTKTRREPFSLKLATKGAGNSCDIVRPGAPENNPQNLKRMQDCKARTLRTPVVSRRERIILLLTWTWPTSSTYKDLQHHDITGMRS